MQAPPGASRRLQTFKDGQRSDRYAIERFDYNRPAYANGYGNGGGDFGYGGYNFPPPIPVVDPNRDNYGGGNGNGFYSVPQGAVGDSAAGFGGAAAAGAGGPPEGNP